MIGPKGADEIVTVDRRPERSLVVAVLAFDGVRPFQLSIPCEVFGDGQPDRAVSELRVCALERAPVRTSSGFSIETPYDLDDLRGADVVFVPSWSDVAEAPPQRLVDALVERHAAGAIIVGLCLGAFVVAAAGLLEGRRATTHWAFGDEFRRKFPNVTLDENVLYVDEGQVVTSAGVASGLDCCLHLARRLFGPRATKALAQNLVLSPIRAGGQAQFVERTFGDVEVETRLQAALEHIRRHLGDAHTIDLVADRMGMSRRSFTRRFFAQTNMTFGAWLLNERLHAARHDLKTTKASIAEISEKLGFGSAASMRARFRETFGVSPRRWREAP